MKKLILRVYDRVIDTIVIGLVLMMLVTLCFAFAEVVVGLIHLAPSLGRAHFADADFRDLVTSVLNVFVIIELFSTFISYVRIKRIHLSMLIDVTAVFTLREMLVKLYAQSFAGQELMILASLLVVLVIARSITGRFQPVADRPGDNAQGSPPDRDN